MARTNAAVAQSKPAPSPAGISRAAALKARRNQKEHEHVEVLENNPRFLEEDQAVNPADLNSDGVIKPPAVDLDTIEDEATRGPVVRRYEVLEGKRVQTTRNGQRTFVHSGKIIDENNYDIPLVTQQGLKLRELEAEDS